jgi:hypothetical protein
VAHVGEKGALGLVGGLGLIARLSEFRGALPHQGAKPVLPFFERLHAQFVGTEEKCDEREYRSGFYPRRFPPGGCSVSLRRASLPVHQSVGRSLHVEKHKELWNVRIAREAMGAVCFRPLPFQRVELNRSGSLGMHAQRGKLKREAALLARVAGPWSQIGAPVRGRFP